MTATKIEYATRVPAAFDRHPTAAICRVSGKKNQEPSTRFMHHMLGIKTPYKEGKEL
jgi:hypothetical protein